MPGEADWARWWGCVRKRRYSSEAAARSAAKAARRQTGAPIRAYQCPHCGGWHVGHRLSKAEHA